MEKRMLISVAEKGELRVAVLLQDRDKLHDLDISHPGVEQKKSNIYKGRISRVEPSLEAAFVDYGADRHGFLPLKEISKLYFLPGFSGDFSRLNIRDVIREGQELIVQIEKEERGNKGAALTTFISLAGSYVVLMPNNPRAAGISRRIEGQERDEMRDILQALKVPEDMGVIVRTAGIGKSISELQWDLDMLLQIWVAILKSGEERTAPFLIYQESDPAVRATRDYLRENLSEIIVDNREVYEKVVGYIQLIRSDFVNKIKLYENKVPLFSQYRLEKQIEAVYRREVYLRSGGSIVIDHTEAMVCIDVNSARSTGGSDIEETALTTNLEAAEEIARQLRLRDIGGLIVIDFIDMENANNQRQVSQRLREALKHDRARVQIGNITRFGLLEMSRQRLRPHISEAIQVSCPRCGGQGTIRSIESLACSIVHLVEEEATKEQVAEIHVQVPVDLATYLLNEKRLSLYQIEKQQEVRVLILPNQHLETPKYKIKSIKKGSASGKPGVNGEEEEGGSGKIEMAPTSSSYKLLENPDALIQQRLATPEKATEEPAVIFGTTQTRLKNQSTSPAAAATVPVSVKVQTFTKPSALQNIFNTIKTIFLGKKNDAVGNVDAINKLKNKDDNKNYRRRSLAAAKKIPRGSGGGGSGSSSRYKPSASGSFNKYSGSGRKPYGYQASSASSQFERPIRRRSDSSPMHNGSSYINSTQPQPSLSPPVTKIGNISGDISAFYKPIESIPTATPPAGVSPVSTTTATEIMINSIPSSHFMPPLDEVIPRAAPVAEKSEYGYGGLKDESEVGRDK